MIKNSKLLIVNIASNSVQEYDPKKFAKNFANKEQLLNGLALIQVVEDDAGKYYKSFIDILFYEEQYLEDVMNIWFGINEESE